jgi:hypothetical protein
LKHARSFCLYLLILLAGVYPTAAQVLGNPGDLPNRQPSALFLAIQQLENTDLADVTAADVTAINAALTLDKIAYRNRFFLLAGWLGQLEALQSVPFEYRRSSRASNDYDLAMIRAGDPGRIERLKRLLQEVEVNDDFVYQLAPKLLYTHRREVIDFFFDEILADKRNCQVADLHSSGQINCAYRLLELLAPRILNFPLQLGVSGDLETDDYPAALATARAWIQAHRNDYVLTTSY